jgi:hypothetical protein
MKELVSDSPIGKVTTYAWRDGDNGEALVGERQTVLHGEHVEGSFGDFVCRDRKNTVCGCHGQ